MGTPTIPLEADQILSHLGADAAAFQLRVIAQCESTNSELLSDPPGDDDRVAVLVCGRQTAGRGRRGRDWLSWGDASLTFSMLWRFAPDAPVPAGLSLVAGLAVARCLEQLGVEGVQLKWPNDVLVHGRKLAGILVELMPGRGRTPAAVVGIGINLSLPAEASLPAGVDAVALDQVIATPPDRNRLLALLLAEFAALFATYATAGFAAFRGAWEQRNAHAGLPVRISGEGREIEGTCLGVDEDGALRLATGSGPQRVLSGEVSLRPQM